METWITRLVASLCAAGSMMFFWILGAFAVVPWRDGRMLSLERLELQLLGVSLIAGCAVGWGALHLMALASPKKNPRQRVLSGVVLIVACVAALIAGIQWTLARIA